MNLNPWLENHWAGNAELTPRHARGCLGLRVIQVKEYLRVGVAWRGSWIYPRPGCCQAGTTR